MKLTTLAAILGLGLGTAAAADPIEGTWKTQADDGAYAHVTIAPCGAGYCGTIRETFNASGAYPSENIGKLLVHNMVPAGNGAYQGKVWRPSNDKIYIGKAQVSGDNMKLSGCIVGGLICAKQTWTRLR